MLTQRAMRGALVVTFLLAPMGSAFAAEYTFRKVLDYTGGSEATIQMDNISFAPVPEPTTGLLVLLGAIVLTRKPRPAIHRFGFQSIGSDQLKSRRREKERK